MPPADETDDGVVRRVRGAAVQRLFDGGGTKRFARFRHGADGLAVLDGESFELERAAIGAGRGRILAASCPAGPGAARLGP